VQAAGPGAGAAGVRSPVSWALVGLVIQRPSYGYELAQRFERSYGDALELSSTSQIYTALDTLSRKGLLEEYVPQGDPAHPGRQPKPHYRATEAGRRGHAQWLVSLVCQERQRSRVFARQLAVLPADEALGVIDLCERACLQDAAQAAPAASPSTTASPSSPRARGGEDGNGPSALAGRLVGEDERVALAARLAWIEFARGELLALANR
jgi:DNA-binding PadR family transcriptional regulator